MKEVSKTILILEEDYVNYLLFKEYFTDPKFDLIRIHNINHIYGIQAKRNIHALIIGETGFNSTSKQSLFNLCINSNFPVFIERGTSLDQPNNLSIFSNCWLIDLFSDEKDIINIIEDYSSLTLIHDITY